VGSVCWQHFCLGEARWDSANGTHEEFGLYELTDWEIFYQLQMIGAGWFTLCIFAISIAIAFSGKIAEPLGKIKFLSISIGIINAIIGILLIIAIENKFAPFTFLSNGLYLLIFAGIAVSVIPFISALAKK